MLLFVVVGMAASGQVSAEPDWMVVRPADTGVALENPGMGWVFHYYDNIPDNYGSRLEPSDTLDYFPGLTVVYLRIPWSYIEPEEGTYNWSVLDTPAQRWIEKGRKIALCISCTESWMRYATPEWVQKAGAKGYNFLPGKGITEDGPFWEPDYDDPVFLEKLDNFLAALAARYDGNPDVAFIDVGSFGVWGEGHTFHTTQLPYSAETVRRHIDLHLKHFKRTLLVANDDYVLQGRGEETLEYAWQKGLTLRDNSILVQGGENAYLSAHLAQRFWPDRPVILECEHYGPSRDRGNWGDGSKYLEAMEKYHASYVSIHWWPDEFYKEQRDLIEEMNRRLGYRLQLVEAAWGSPVFVGGRLKLRWTWRNAGVAPCYAGGYPALTLKDERGGIAGVFVDGRLNVRHLPVGPPGEAETRSRESEFDLPFQLKAGRYDVFVSVGTATGTPVIALPLAGEDGQRRYKVGEISVLGDYLVQVGDLQRRGETYFLPAVWEAHRPLPPSTIPFCHFEQGGRIDFYGEPEQGGPAEELLRPGATEWGFVFPVPAEARGRVFDVYIGLWVTDRARQPDERLIPDQHAGDRRVYIGKLRVDGMGQATLIKGK
ncbi:MAG: DUF4832 domain-containing protein [Armatimonadetes bacterium]|nr:DUF4832 domain-containing protein [Armatimonadota bacterium]